MDFKVQWFIDDKESAEYTVTLLDSEKDEEKNWLEINLEEHLDCKPIAVKQGQKIIICVTYQGEDFIEVYNGDGGSESSYSKIEAQDLDF